MSSTRGIVVGKTDFGESDRYVQFITRDWGLINTLAKSARKSKRRYVGGLDLFCHDEILLRGNPREKPYLVELSVLNSFNGIRDDLERLLSAGRITQWVRRLADTSPTPAIYSLFGQTLALIERESDTHRLDLLELVFKVKLLDTLGLRPRLDSCARCGATEVAHGIFDVAAGGLVCEHCSRAVPGMEEARSYLSTEARTRLSDLQRLRLTGWEEVTADLGTTAALNRLVTVFARYHTQIPVP